jgi:hypothetical protein
LASPSESLPLTVSPLDVSSRRPPSPVREHGGPSKEIPMVNLSSDEEENTLPDTSRDEEFTQRLFVNINRGLLGPPDDNNVIILNDSDDEEEVGEEITTDTKAAPPSAVNSPTPTVSTADADDAPDGVQYDSNDGRTPDRAQNDSSDDGDDVGSP